MLRQQARNSSSLTEVLEDIEEFAKAIMTKEPAQPRGSQCTTNRRYCGLVSGSVQDTTSQGDRSDMHAAVPDCYWRAGFARRSNTSGKFALIICSVISIVTKAT